MNNRADQKPEPVNIDALMQRIRETVHLRPSGDADAGSSDGNLAAITEFQSTLAEESALASSMLGAMEALATQLRDVQEHIAKIDDFRGREVERATDSIHLVRDEIEAMRDSLDERGGQLEGLVARLYALEPKLESDLAKFRQMTKARLDAFAAEVTAKLEHHSATVSDRQPALVAAILDQRFGVHERTVRDLTTRSEERLVQLESRLEQQSRAFNDLRNEANASATFGDEQVKILQASAEASGRFKESLNAFQGELDIQKEFTARLQDLQRTTAAELSDQVRRIGGYEAVSESTGRRLDQLEGQLAAAPFDELSNRLSKVEDGYKILENTLEELRSAISVIPELSDQLRRQHQSHVQTDSHLNQIALQVSHVSETLGGEANVLRRALAEHRVGTEQAHAELGTKVAGAYAAVDELRGRFLAQFDELLSQRDEHGRLLTALQSRQDDLARQLVDHQQGATLSLSEMKGHFADSLGQAVSTVDERLQSLQSGAKTELTSTQEQLQSVSREQQELQRKVDAAVGRFEHEHTHQTEAMQATQATTAAELESALAKLRNISDSLRSEVTTVAANLEQKIDQHLTETRASSSHDLDAVRMRLLRIERRLRDSAPVAAGETADNAGSTGESAAPGFDYFLFEHQWRGSLADIKHRQAQYLDLFRDRKSVVDLGCGRGEFVELLTENGIGVTGVDASEDMVDFCVARSLPVDRRDLFEFLEASEAAQFDAITAFQVVEHMAPNDILRLLSLAHAKLTPGGVLLLETVNPSCPLALGNFYLDPTHVRPVPAKMLAFMCNSVGLKVDFIRYSAPVEGSGTAPTLQVKDESPGAIAAYQDYALIARRNIAVHGA